MTASEILDSLDPVWWSVQRAARICADHGADLAEYQRECPTEGDRVDARLILAWLGY